MHNKRITEDTVKMTERGTAFIDLKKYDSIKALGHEKTSFVQYENETNKP